VSKFNDKLKIFLEISKIQKNYSQFNKLIEKILKIFINKFEISDGFNDEFNDILNLCKIVVKKN
jgi:hypothetical protein